MCPSLGVHGTRDRDGTDAVGTALPDDWEIDVMCSLARSLGRSLDRTNEGAISRPIDRIDLFASGISSRVRVFVPSCTHSFIHSFIHSFEPSTFIITAVDSDSEEPGTPTKAIGRRVISRSVVGYWTRVARHP